MSRSFLFGEIFNYSSVIYGANSCHTSPSGLAKNVIG
jgi:hypothetical protein